MSETNTDVIKVDVQQDKIVEKETFITKENDVLVYQTEIREVERYEDRIVPVTSTIEKIVEVPYILEKIVEKIVIMPQIVEVLKYVHEIVEEETLGVAVGVDVTVQEARYKELYGKVKIQFDGLLAELKRMRTSNPNLRVQIDMIEGFLIELNKIISFPRIVQVEKEKIVEVDKNRPVLVPKLDLQGERFTVTLGMIISKLLGELLRIKDKNPGVKLELDADILRMFSEQFKEKSGVLNVGGNFSANLDRIYGFYDNFLSGLGGSNLTNDQQLMYTAALEERLLVASLVKEANLEIKKAQ